jgi:hypothetical protein
VTQNQNISTNRKSVLYGELNDIKSKQKAIQFLGENPEIF